MNKSKAKCPKCRSKNLTIAEMYDSTIEWIQEDGFFNKNEGSMEHGSVTGTFGECAECLHRWKFRTLQVTDLIIEP